MLIGVNLLIIQSINVNPIFFKMHYCISSFLQNADCCYAASRRVECPPKCTNQLFCTCLQSWTWSLKLDSVYLCCKSASKNALQQMYIYWPKNWFIDHLHFYVLVMTDFLLCGHTLALALGGKGGWTQTQLWKYAH